jgi:hypothetical protein
MSEIRREEESNIYRDNLAEELKETPKEERSEVLAEAKKDPEYWKERNKKIEGRQNEEEIDDGLGIFVKKKNLYRGEGHYGKKEGGLKVAEDTRSTVGEGVYFTSQAKDAVGYAYERSGPTDKSPIIYECSIENMKLIDLRKDENVKKILPGFKKILKDQLKNPEYEMFKDHLYNAVDAIDDGKIGSGNLKLAVGGFDQLFSDYIKSLGYDGLATFEGGELIVKKHDTYVIFDPEKVKVVKEQKINKIKK